MALCLILRGKNLKLLKNMQKKKLGFLAIEYSGHGKSSQVNFTKGNISQMV